MLVKFNFCLIKKDAQIQAVILYPRQIAILVSPVGSVRLEIIGL